MRCLSLALTLALASVGLLGGCTQTLEPGGEELPLAPNYLRLQGWVAVSPNSVSLQGFLRWIYVADDPGVVAEPREYCEVWELLELEQVQQDAGCPDCLNQYAGTATVQDDQGTCLGVDWRVREFELGFSSISAASEEVAALSSEGFTHLVQAPWSPERGSTDAFEPMFVAEPERWSTDDAPIGTSGDRPLEGDYHLFCLYYWDTQDADVP